MPDYQKLIADECDKVKKLLLAKNKAYGSAVFEPSGVFSKLTPVEQIKVRVDDKLKRISTMGTKVEGKGVIDEDTLQDLIGYLIILKVATRGTEKK